MLPEQGLLTYPKDSAYTRIVLQQLRPRGVSIRLATLADLPELLGKLARSQLEGLLRKKVSDGTPVRRSDLLDALERGGGDADGRERKPSVGMLTIDGVQYEVSLASSQGIR